MSTELNAIGALLLYLHRQNVQLPEVNLQPSDEDYGKIVNYYPTIAVRHHVVDFGVVQMDVRVTIGTHVFGAAQGYTLVDLAAYSNEFLSLKVKALWQDLLLSIEHWANPPEITNDTELEQNLDTDSGLVPEE
jgi:hypothetical protein